jgi:hypothetical protein
MAPRSCSIRRPRGALCPRSPVSSRCSTDAFFPSSDALRRCRGAPAPNFGHEDPGDDTNRACIRFAPVALSFEADGADHRRTRWKRRVGRAPRRAPFRCTAIGLLAVSILEPHPQYLSGEQDVVLSPYVDPQRAERGLTSLSVQVFEVADPPTPCHTGVIVAEPAHGIAEVARTQRSPMIVMGIGRHRPLDGMLGLETAVRTVRRATVRCSL